MRKNYKYNNRNHYYVCEIVTYYHNETFVNCVLLRKNDKMNHQKAVCKGGKQRKNGRQR